MYIRYIIWKCVGTYYIKNRTNMRLSPFVVPTYTKQLNTVKYVFFSVYIIHAVVFKFIGGFCRFCFFFRGKEKRSSTIISIAGCTVVDPKDFNDGLQLLYLQCYVYGKWVIDISRRSAQRRYHTVSAHSLRRPRLTGFHDPCVLLCVLLLYIIYYLLFSKTSFTD